MSGGVCWTPPAGMRSLDGSVFDGRLDNRREIARKLALGEGNGVPDTALVLRLYRQCGLPALNQLVGDWRAVIRDEETESVTLAVDHAGSRPLFYRWSNRRLQWSSSLRGLVIPSDSSDLDEGYMAALLTGGPTVDRTPFRAVRAVAPGQAVTFTADRMWTQRTWAFPQEREARTTRADLAEQLRTLVTEAVSARLQTPDSVMAECSGGLDSSLIICVANEQIRKGQVPARKLLAMHYSIEGSVDARFQAEVVAKCEIPLVRIENGKFPLLAALDEHPPMTPIIGVPRIREVGARMEAAGANLLLTGQLGDLVMGNISDDYDQAADLFRSGRLIGGIRESFAWSAARRYPIWSVIGQAARSAAGIAHPTDWFSTIVRGESSLLPHRLQEMALATASERRRELHRSDLGPSHRRRHHALRDILDAGALRTSESLGAGATSHPFSHRPLLDFMFGIPTRYVCRPSAPRQLMREAFAAVLPPAILHRRSKASVTSAVYDAVRTTAAHLMRSSSPWRVVEFGFADQAKLHKQLDRYLQCLPCAEHQIHRIVTLEAWLRNYLAYGQAEREGHAKAE